MPDEGRAVREVEGATSAHGIGLGASDDIPEERGEVHGLGFEREPIRADARDVEQGIDELVEPFSGPAGSLDALAGRVGTALRIGLGERAPQQLELELERGQGRLELVRGDGEEVVATLQGLLEIRGEGLHFAAGEHLFGDLRADAHGAENVALDAEPGLPSEIEVLHLGLAGAGEVGAQGDLMAHERSAGAEDLVEQVEIQPGDGVAHGMTGTQVLAHEGAAQRVDELDDVLGAEGETDGDGGLEEEGFQPFALGLDLQVGIVLTGEELGARLLLAEAGGDVAEDDEAAAWTARELRERGGDMLDGKFGAGA